MQKMKLAVYSSQEILKDYHADMCWIKRLKYEAAIILLACILCLLLYFQLDNSNLMATIETSQTERISDSNRTNSLEGTLTFLNQTLLSDLVGKGDRISHSDKYCFRDEKSQDNFWGKSYSRRIST